MIDDSITKCVSDANNFFEIACYCENKMVMHEYSYMSVFATNLSFACELYFKAILIKEEQELIKGHHLEGLFSQLSKQTQNILKKEFNKNRYIRSLKDTLNNCDNIFIDFRYLYENDKIKELHTTDLSNLVNSLRVVCKSEFKFNIE